MWRKHLREFSLGEDFFIFLFMYFLSNCALGLLGRCRDRDDEFVRLLGGERGEFGGLLLQPLLSGE